MPAAAVIPTLRFYEKIDAVKKLVVGNMGIRGIKIFVLVERLIQ